MTTENTTPSVREQIIELAKARGITVQECLRKIVEGYRIIKKYREERQSVIEPDSEKGGTGLHG